MPRPALALIDPDAARRRRLADMLELLGLPCRPLEAAPHATTPDLAAMRLVICVGDPDIAGILLLRAACGQARILVASPDASQAAAVSAFRAGADDFVWLGAGDAELAMQAGSHLAATAPAPSEAGDLVGSSTAMTALRGFVQRLAGSEATVLISGETGTGKERTALLVHRLSRRARGPLVALNCAAIPEALLEGELFGYERGAFSGAVAAYPGKLKLADGGTLLLDEVGELSPAGQAKVLRALETREVYRLGARTPTRFDVRLVAATNRDLEAEMRAGRFRADLYYRLAVARLHLPPLRDRREDIGDIARRLLAEVAPAGGSPPSLDEAAIERLQRHDWPGNARELRNVLEIALLQGDGRRIRCRDLPDGIGLATTAPEGETGALAEERSRLRAALTEAGGNKTLAATALNCSRMTLYRRLVRCGLVSEQDAAGAVTVSRRPMREPLHGL